jgi:Holliday junction resolvase-like predicted endonuclease
MLTHGHRIARPYYFNGQRFDVTEVKLIDHHHPAYHVWQRAYRAKNRTTTEQTDQVAAEYGRRLQRWETLVRSFIHSTGAPLLSKRYLAFKQRRRFCRGEWRQNCREIDVVFGNDTKPTILCEVKLRERTSYRANSGIGQVKASIAVASARWSDVRGALINVYLGGVLRLPQAENDEKKFCQLEDLRSVIENECQNEIPTIWIDGGKLLEFGQKIGHLSLGEADELSVLRHHTFTPAARIAVTESQDRRDSSLRAALKSAGFSDQQLADD